MNPRKFAYLAHRWLGLVVALQLLAWSLGGLTFSLLDIRHVRGESLSSLRSARPLDGAILPAPIADALSRDPRPGLARAELIDRGQGPRWELRDEQARLLAVLLPDGRPAPPLTAEQARAQALADFTGSPASPSDIRLITADPPVEYRDKPLPAWRVDLDHPEAPHLYVDAATGEITARRNRAWRLFDFFWMLHTMDYRTRDNFNHPLLTTASLFAVATAGSGLALWVWRLLPSARRPRPTPH